MLHHFTRVAHASHTTSISGVSLVLPSLCRFMSCDGIPHAIAVYREMLLDDMTRFSSVYRVQDEGRRGTLCSNCPHVHWRQHPPSLPGACGAAFSCRRQEDDDDAHSDHDVGRDGSDPITTKDWMGSAEWATAQLNFTGRVRTALRDSARAATSLYGVDTGPPADSQLR